MQIILLLITFCSITLFEAPYLIRKKMWRELIAFSILLIIGFTLSLLQIIRVKIPNPTVLIENIFGFLK